MTRERDRQKFLLSLELILGWLEVDGWVEGQMTALSQAELLHSYSGLGNVKEMGGMMVNNDINAFIVSSICSVLTRGRTTFFTYTVSFCLPLEVGVIYYLHFTDEATEAK